MKLVINHIINPRKILLVSIFWAMSFMIVFRIFTREYNNGAVDFIYTLLFHIPLIVVVSLNYLLIRYLIDKKHYLFYLATIPILILTALGVHYLVFQFLGGLLFSGYYFISDLSIYEVIQYYMVYIVASLLIILSYNYFKLTEKQTRLENKNREVQLESLKAQINPHFLFNSLNNIYALSSNVSSQSRSYIIKLSDALRYMLYRTNNEKVELIEEIDYIRNYIDLESLRLEYNAKLSVNIDIKDSGYMIAPLIILPIIENCFKHSSKDLVDITIDIHQDDHDLILNCSNSFDNIMSDFKEGGIGLSNMKKRLELIYPGKHRFKSHISNKRYHTKLALTLD